VAIKEMAQQNNNSNKGMPVEERRKDGVAPFNTPPHNLKEPATMDRKLPEKKTKEHQEKPLQGACGIQF
jgi:hypothetical protein